MSIGNSRELGSAGLRDDPLVPRRHNPRLGWQLRQHHAVGLSWRRKLHQPCNAAGDSLDALLHGGAECIVQKRRTAAVHSGRVSLERQALSL